AYCWVTFDQEDISELGLSFSLKAGEAYIWDCATLPAYRGQHLYPALLHYILTTLQSGGLQRIWIGADADNLASQSGMILAGFQPMADYLLARESTQHRAWLRGRTDVAEQDILDVHAALFVDQ